jgi:pimeloyl-ACP methyl ester carboxylesterase
MAEPSPGSESSGSVVRTDEVCFSVHNEGDAHASPLYGIRYYADVPSTRTKTIVLVHGAGPSHHYWDLRPDFSIARNLAAAGYLAITYDRLGYASREVRWTNVAVATPVGIRCRSPSTTWRVVPAGRSRNSNATDATSGEANAHNNDSLRGRERHVERPSPSAAVRP